MKSFFLPVVPFLMTFSLLGEEEPRSFILEGGGAFEFGSAVPGMIGISSAEGFPVLLDENGGAIAAGSRSGKGRVVGFTHGSFLISGAFLQQAPVWNLVRNSIRWAARSGTPRVGLHPGLRGLRKNLETSGFEVAVFPPGEIRKHEVSAYCLIGHENLNRGEIEGLRHFVGEGGGLVTATTPWAFKNRYESFSQLPGNQLLAGSGLQFLPDGYAAGGKIEIGSGLNDPKASPEGAPGAIERLLSERETLGAGELETLTASMRMGRTLSGSARRMFLERLRALNESVGPIVPTKQAPFQPGADPVADAIVELETHFNETSPAGVMYAIPAAADYPGTIPAKAERVTHSFTMDGTYRGWLEGRNAGGWAAKEMRPTGIYAPPGEVVEVSLPEELAGKGFEIVIGSYGGNLRNRDKWHRYPDWQVSRAVEGENTKISSGFGGLVTIRIPRESDYREIEVTIEGGVRAPLYEHGKTDLEEWTSEIRKYPAPWAELASSRMIVAIPSEYIRDLKDPDRVMEIWDAFIDTAAELVRVDRDDYRAERIVFDRQTSAGYMHSSYPVAAHLEGGAAQAVDAEKLKDGNWGFFHEYGHNHQHNLWALPGTGETTCNLWSIYIYEKYVGKDRDETHRAIHPLNRKQRINAYFEKPAAFESDWNVWTALETYLMVQEEFGWEPFQRVFDEYNRLPTEERPRGQQEINDQWVVRLSRACGKNLQPFWATWKLPMTEKVAAELKDLPVWEDHPVRRWAGSGDRGRDAVSNPDPGSPIP